jgi:hypothetical protein
MKERERQETRQKIGRFLFSNPWSSLGVACALTGTGYRAGSQGLSDGACFERVRVPRGDARGYQDLYALTGQGQKELVGRYRSPGTLAEALLLSFSRLSLARDLLASLHKTERLIWSISPWKPRTRSPYFDALLGLDLGEGRAVLAALVTPLSTARWEWYTDLVREWENWRKSSDPLPTLLVLWEPPLPQRLLEALWTRVPGNLAGDILVLQGDHGWMSLLGMAKPGRIIASAPRVLLAEEAFLGGARKTPFSFASTLRFWSAKTSSPLGRPLADFLRSRPGEIALLETIARFPGLTARGLRTLDPRQKAGRALSRRLATLKSRGWINAWGEGPQFYLLAGLGLEYLAGVGGVAPGAENRYLGFPVRPGRFVGTRAHLTLVNDFLLRLARENRLLGWDGLSARYVFGLAPSADRIRIQKLVIQPDGAGILSLRGGKTAPFWLEVDRGTRRGKSIHWKLEKYFLAKGARQASSAVPPLLVVVDTGVGNDEARLRFLIRQFAILGRKHPLSVLVVLLTTGELLDGVKGSILDGRVWRCFSQGQWSSDLISMRNGMGKES